jgi:hypothetical protein
MIIFEYAGVLQATWGNKTGGFQGSNGTYRFEEKAVLLGKCFFYHHGRALFSELEPRATEPKER